METFQPIKQELEIFDIDEGAIGTILIQLRVLRDNEVSNAYKNKNNGYLPQKVNLLGSG